MYNINDRIDVFTESKSYNRLYGNYRLSFRRPFYFGGNMKRIGVIGIVVENRSVVSDVQNLLSEFSEIILGRMGIPDRESGISAISLIIKGSVEEISALTGKLGKIRNISVKSALTGVDLK